MRLTVPSSAGWPVCWFGSPLVGGSAPSLRPFSVSVSAGAAHRGGNWATLGRTQGLDSALVCGVCFLNRGPCVRTPRGWCAIRSSPPGVWPWCGCSPWCGRALSTVSAACLALVRVFLRAVGVVDRVHVDRVRSALGLSEGAPPGAAGVVGRVRSAPGPGAGAPPGAAGVVGRVRSAPGPGAGAPPGVDARCRHREGVVDIVRGLLTPRGGYNARWCQQRASVPISHADCQQRASVRTTRAHADNARRHPRPEPSSAVTAAHARGHTRQSPQSVPQGPSSAQPSRRPGPHPAVTAVRARGPRRRSAGRYPTTAPSHPTTASRGQWCTGA